MKDEGKETSWRDSLSKWVGEVKTLTEDVMASYETDVLGKHKQQGEYAPAVQKRARVAPPAPNRKAYKPVEISATSSTKSLETKVSKSPLEEELSVLGSLLDMADKYLVGGELFGETTPGINKEAQEEARKKAYELEILELRFIDQLNRFLFLKDQNTEVKLGVGVIGRVTRAYEKLTTPETDRHLSVTERFTNAQKNAFEYVLTEIQKMPNVSSGIQDFLQFYSEGTDFLIGLQQFNIAEKQVALSTLVTELTEINTLYLQEKNKEIEQLLTDKTQLQSALDDLNQAASFNKMEDKDYHSLKTKLEQQILISDAFNGFSPSSSNPLEILKEWMKNAPQSHEVSQQLIKNASMMRNTFLTDKQSIVSNKKTNIQELDTSIQQLKGIYSGYSLEFHKAIPEFSPDIMNQEADIDVHIEALKGTMLAMREELIKFQKEAVETVQAGLDLQDFTHLTSRNALKAGCEQAKAALQTNTTQLIEDQKELINKNNVSNFKALMESLQASTVVLQNDAEALGNLSIAANKMQSKIDLPFYKRIESKIIPEIENEFDRIYRKLIPETKFNKPASEKGNPFSHFIKTENRENSTLGEMDPRLPKLLNMAAIFIDANSTFIQSKSMSNEEYTKGAKSLIDEHIINCKFTELSDGVRNPFIQWIRKTLIPLCKDMASRAGFFSPAATRKEPVKGSTITEDKIINLANDLKDSEKEDLGSGVGGMGGL